MNILVTGSAGFAGRSLVENLKNIRDGKDRTRPGIHIEQIFEFDAEDEIEKLDAYCKDADFVFHFAGVNRPQNPDDFMKGNYEAAGILLDKLKASHNRCPVMLSSSVQASLEGRYEGSGYGMSKKAAEELLFQYGRKNHVKVLVVRFPPLFGKWCRPGYNSAVATFCHAAANNLEYTVNDPNTVLELLYIDDLVSGMLDALEGKEQHCEYDGLKPVADSSGKYCYVPGTFHVRLGEISDLLETFKQMPETLVLPHIPEGSFEKKLYSTYLSYLPKDAVAYELAMNVDNRGIFTELFKTAGYGQVNINVARPGSVRGQHWHNSKSEIFVVVSGHGLIQERKIGTDAETGKPYPLIEFEVTGDQMRAVQMLPGYTHNIINLSSTENLVTVMWANEAFDPEHPDTFYEAVEKM